MELLQLAAGIDAELLDQGSAGAVELAQCLALPARPVQGERELSPQALAERMLGDELADPRDDKIVLADHQPGVDLVLEGGGSQLLETGGLGDRGRSIRQVLEWVAAPEAESGPQFVQGNVGVDRPRRRQPRRRRADEGFEAAGVERVRIDVEQVSGAHPAQRRPAGARSQPDGAAQVRHLHLQGVDGVGQHLLAPDLLDEGVHGRHPPQPQQQRRQEGARSSLAEGEQPPIVANLEGAEDSELHRGEGNDGRQVAVSDVTARRQGDQRS